MTQRTHPYPSRTRKLSSEVPMILGGKLPGKVGRCRNKKREHTLSLFECRMQSAKCRIVVKKRPKALFIN